MINIIIDLKHEGLNLTKEVKLCQKVCLYLRGIHSQPNDTEGLSETIEEQKACVVMYINNVSKEQCPSLIPPGILINELVNNLYAEPAFQDKVFHVFVDEFENLLDYQQVLINSFINQPECFGNFPLDIKALLLLSVFYK